MCKYCEKVSSHKSEFTGQIIAETDHFNPAIMEGTPAEIQAKIRWFCDDIGQDDTEIYIHDVSDSEHDRDCHITINYCPFCGKHLVF